MGVWADRPPERDFYKIRFEFMAYRGDQWLDYDGYNCDSTISGCGWLEVIWEAMEMANRVRSWVLFKGWDKCSYFRSSCWYGRNEDFYQNTSWKHGIMTYHQKTRLRWDADATLLAREEKRRKNMEAYYARQNNSGD